MRDFPVCTAFCDAMLPSGAASSWSTWRTFVFCLGPATASIWALATAKRGQKMVQIPVTNRALANDAHVCALHWPF